MTLSFENLHPRGSAGLFVEKTHLEAEGSLQTQVDDAQTAAILQAAQKASAYASYRLGSHDHSFDADDASQDAVLAVLEARANGRTYTDERSAAASIAKTVITRRFYGSVHHTDMRAAKQFHIQEAELVATLGRDLRPSERSELQAKIREDWNDPERRPSKNFLDKCRNRHPSYLADNNIEMASSLAAVESRMLAEEGIWTAKALDARASSSQAEILASRRYAINSLAEMFAMRNGEPAPFVNEGSIPRGRCTQMTSAMKAQPGGVVQAIRDHSAGLDTEGTRALFGPWGDTLSTRGQEQVCQMLESAGGRADELWRAAVGLAKVRPS